MRMSELLRRKVVSESGVSHGRVHDIRGELEGGRLRVSGLACGSLGLLERYGVGTGGTGGGACGTGGGKSPPAARGAAGPWSPVASPRRSRSSAALQAEGTGRADPAR